MIETIHFENRDCVEAMKEFPDNFFELAIVDPPYGIGIDGQKKCVCKKRKHNRKYHEKRNWDTGTPTREYFQQLFRVSKNQIIFGANYFVKELKEAHKGWIVWDKGQHGLTMSDCELAYTSFDFPTRVITINRVELLKEQTIHPTQKPMKLYRWILANYAKQGDKIIDTHVGSASSLIACERMGFECWGYEIDETYYKLAQERIRRELAQGTLF